MSNTNTDPVHDNYMRSIAPKNAPLGHILFDELSGRRVWVVIHRDRYVSDVTRRYDDFATLMTAYGLQSGRWRIRACSPGEQAEVLRMNRQLMTA